MCIGCVFPWDVEIRRDWWIFHCPDSCQLYKAWLLGRSKCTIIEGKQRPYFSLSFPLLFRIVHFLFPITFSLRNNIEKNTTCSCIYSVFLEWKKQKNSWNGSNVANLRWYLSFYMHTKTHDFEHMTESFQRKQSIRRFLFFTFPLRLLEEGSSGYSSNRYSIMSGAV